MTETTPHDGEGASAEPAYDAPAGLRRRVRRAEKIGKDKARVKQLVAEAGVKAARSRERLGDAWEQLQTLFRLLKAWVTGQYHDVPWRVIVLAIASILYFVNPFDLIPDFLGFGLLDDIGVIGFAIAQMRADIDRFRAWEKTSGTGGGRTEGATPTEPKATKNATKGTTTRAPKKRATGAKKAAKATKAVTAKRSTSSRSKA